MNDHIIASVKTALSNGQIADDALLIHRTAVSWAHDELAADQLAKFLDATGHLYTDAIAEATKAGLTLDLRDRPACATHRYYPDFRGGCPICL